MALPVRWMLVAGVVLVGALLRFLTLGQQSFWFDEATTWQIVSHGLGHVFRQVSRTESTPPLYYVLLWLWSRLFGVGEWGLRSFSALCGTATIPVVWAIGRRLASARVGITIALLTAVNPLLLRYSQEARSSYALLLLASAITLLALLRALESPTRGRPVVPPALAGFAVRARTRTSSYFVVRYGAPRPIWEPYAALDRLYPDPARATALLQDP